MALVGTWGLCKGELWFNGCWLSLVGVVLTVMWKGYALRNSFALGPRGWAWGGWVASAGVAAFDVRADVPLQGRLGPHGGVGGGSTGSAPQGRGLEPETS